MNYLRDLIPGTILFVFSAIYYRLAFDIKVFKGIGSTPLTAQFMPKFWGICMMLLSAILIVRGLKARRKAIAAACAEAGTPKTSFWYENYPVVLTFVLLAIYIWLLSSVGFIICSAVYMFLEMMILCPEGKRTYILPVIISVIFAVGLDYIFVVLLRVLLPAGILGF